MEEKGEKDDDKKSKKGNKEKQKDDIEDKSRSWRREEEKEEKLNKNETRKQVELRLLFHVHTCLIQKTITLRTHLLPHDQRVRSYSKYYA
jgi:hypothetical protein